MIETKQYPCINRCVRRGTEDELLPARHGKYCSRCWGRIDRALHEAPLVTEHVVSMLTSKADQDVKVDGKSDPNPAPFNAQAFDDANEVYMSLVYWASIIADTIMATPPTPAKASWRNHDGQIVGLPANITPTHARYVVGVVAEWMRIHLDDYLDYAFLHDVDELTEALKKVFRVNARWPRQPKPRFADMPCPDDECKGRIAVYPPDDFGDDQRIVCEKCGRWFRDDEFEHLIRVFKQIKAEQNRNSAIKAIRSAERTKKHLAAKYGQNIA